MGSSLACGEMIRLRDNDAVLPAITRAGIPCGRLPGSGKVGEVGFAARYVDTQTPANQWLLVFRTMRNCPFYGTAR